MDRRLMIATLAGLASLGCVTSTAHRLPIVNNPLRAEAEACEARCHALLEPPLRCKPREGESRCDPAGSFVDRGRYARCLDSCPGATAIDGASCFALPSPDDVCEETQKANAGGVAGGIVAVGAVVGSIVLLSAFFGALDKNVGPLPPFNFPSY